MRAHRGIVRSHDVPIVTMMKFDLFSVAAPIIAVGLAAEVLLPYGLLWLSNEFLFDIPNWALWFALVGPPVAGMATFVGEVLTMRRKAFFFEKKKQKTFAT